MFGQSLLYRLLLALAVACCLGCGADPPRLYCGAGIQPPVAELVEQFNREHGVSIVCDYAASEMLLGRIKVSRRGDLYIPGDVHYIEQAREEGLIASSRTVCYFVPVIMVQKGNPHEVHALADLLRPGLKIGLGDPKSCAIGRQCSKIFARAGIDEEQLRKNVEFPALTVNELGNHMKVGQLDAVIVWDATAAAYPDTTDVVPIPSEQNVISTVAVGVLNSSEHRELAEEFVEFVTSPQGQAVFAKHHYTTTKP